MEKFDKKIVLKGAYEDIISEGGHYYISHKKDKVCVLPYTISSNGLLDKIGVIREVDVINEKENFVLINGYINQDDPTNLVCANRLMFEIIGSNATKADDWMYLGKLNNTAVSSDMIIYCVNISDIDINESPEVEESKKERKFQMVDSNKVVVSDDALFLAAYLRMFNYFYITAISK